MLECCGTIGPAVFGAVPIEWLGQPTLIDGTGVKHPVERTITGEVLAVDRAGDIPCRLAGNAMGRNGGLKGKQAYSRHQGRMGRFGWV